MDDNALVELVGMILCNAVILNAIIEMLGVICRLRKKNGKKEREREYERIDIECFRIEIY